MDEPIYSEFSTFYYAKVIGVIVLSVMICLVFIYNSIVKQETGSNLISTVIFCIASIAIGYYYLFRNCFNVTVTEAGIFINYYIRNKQLEISYNDVVKVGTYRQKNTDRAAITNYQDFVIELKNGQSVSLSAGDYNNYDDIKAAVYKYKLGIGV
ncbi:MAG: hypothetical protein JWR50_3139 [Mucilaginibacter sp.]|nr:hypothetical protein [Mucilaginibacter sp.]